MLSQPHEYTSLQADRASIGPASKQVSFVGQGGKEVVSPYMAFMKKQFSFGGSNSDAETSENSQDDDEDGEENGDGGDRDSDSPVKGAHSRVDGPTSNKMSGLFKPLGSLIEKARSMSRGKTRGTPGGDSPANGDQTRSESRSKLRSGKPDQDAAESSTSGSISGAVSSMIRSISRGKTRDSKKSSSTTTSSTTTTSSSTEAGGSNGNESRSRLSRVDLPHENDNAASDTGAGYRQPPARSPGPSREKKAQRSPVFTVQDDSD